MHVQGTPAQGMACARISCLDNSIIILAQDRCVTIGQFYLQLACTRTTCARKYNLLAHHHVRCHCVVIVVHRRDNSSWCGYSFPYEPHRESEIRTRNTEEKTKRRGEHHCLTKTIRRETLKLNKNNSWHTDVYSYISEHTEPTTIATT